MNRTAATAGARGTTTRRLGWTRAASASCNTAASSTNQAAGRQRHLTGMVDARFGLLLHDPLARRGRDRRTRVPARTGAARRPPRRARRDTAGTRWQRSFNTNVGVPWWWDWHVYGVRWAQDRIEFQVDGSTRWTITPGRHAVGRALGVQPAPSSCSSTSPSPGGVQRGPVTVPGPGAVPGRDARRLDARLLDTPALSLRALG